MAPTIELRGLEKRFGDFYAVSGVSFAVRPGTIYGLLGPNGAGKTTTIRMLMDIIAPDRGEVHLFGRPRTPRDADRIGYLPEERGLYRKMTVTDHLLFLAELHGRRRKEVVGEVSDWLERVDLATWAKKKVEELSKGMQQKIQLIGTVLHQPDILVLDEPFSGLDPINQSLFKDLLAEYRDRGRTILFSTHIMEQAEKLCDEICLISEGRAILDGPLTRIKRDFGGGSYRLVGSAKLEELQGVKGIRQVIPQEGHFRLLLEDAADPSRVLRDLLPLATVHEFLSEEPDLEEIFITAVRNAPEERSRHHQA